MQIDFSRWRSLLSALEAQLDLRSSSLLPHNKPNSNLESQRLLVTGHDAAPSGSSHRHATDRSCE
jgi:hypothetical protein